MCIDFCGFFDVAFDPHILSVVCFVIDHVAKLVLFASVAEADDYYSSFKSNAMATPAVFTVLGRVSTIRFCHT